MKLAEFPRYPLTFGPSPLQHLKRLTQHLGGAQVWAKREDVSSGLAYGGNKIRKLEYIVPDVLASGADTLVSIGGYQSNHTRQVAAVAAHLGLKARLVQEKWVPWDDPTNDRVGNILLSRMMGADSRLDDAGLRHRRARLVEERARRGGGIRRQALPDPRRRLRAPARRSGLRELGVRARRAGEGSRHHVRHDHRLHGHRLDARRHDRGLRRARRPHRREAARARHRRLGHPRQDDRSGRPHRPQHRRAHRARPRPARRRDPGARGLGGRPLRHPRRLDDGGHGPRARSSRR